MFGLYALLGALGLPTFYDKLMTVPLLNLAVPWIDRGSARIGDAPMLHTLGLDPPLGRANLAHMAVWVLIFGVMTTLGAADGMHKGDSLPFWEQACAADKPQACARLLRIEASYCGDNAGWACNELGRHYTEGRLVPADPERAFAYFCARLRGAIPGRLRQPARCIHAGAANPRAFDLRLLVREGGPNLIDMPEPELYARACSHGWDFACGKAAASAMRRRGVARPGDASRCWLARSPPARGRMRLPDFVEIPAGPFTMGADPATRSARVRQREVAGARRVSAPSTCPPSTLRSTK